MTERIKVGKYIGKVFDGKVNPELILHIKSASGNKLEGTVKHIKHSKFPGISIVGAVGPGPAEINVTWTSTDWATNKSGKPNGSLPTRDGLEHGTCYRLVLRWDSGEGALKGKAMVLDWQDMESANPKGGELFANRAILYPQSVANARQEVGSLAESLGIVGLHWGCTFRVLRFHGITVCIHPVIVPFFAIIWITGGAVGGLFGFLVNLLLSGPFLLGSLMWQETLHIAMAYVMGMGFDYVLLWPMGGMRFPTSPSPLAQIVTSLTPALSHVPWIILWAWAGNGVAEGLQLGNMDMSECVDLTVCLWPALTMGLLHQHMLLLAANLVVPAYPLGGGRLIPALLYMCTNKQPDSLAAGFIWTQLAFAVGCVVWGVWQVSSHSNANTVWEMLLGLWLLVHGLGMYRLHRNNRLARHPLFQIWAQDIDNAVDLEAAAKAKGSQLTTRHLGGGVTPRTPRSQAPRSNTSSAKAEGTKPSTAAATKEHITAAPAPAEQGDEFNPFSPRNLRPTNDSITSVDSASSLDAPLRRVSMKQLSLDSDVIREGWCEKQSQKVRKWNVRYLVVKMEGGRSDMRIYHTQADWKTGSANFKVIQLLPHDVVISKYDSGEKARQFTFIRSVGGQVIDKTKFRVASQKERNQWAKTLSGTIALVEAKANTDNPFTPR